VSNSVRNTQSTVPAKARSTRSGEKGAEMVEFALVFAALMALMLGIVVFARAYNVYETITRAAREGARMAALPTSVYDGNSFVDGSTSGVTQATNSQIFSQYIAPALSASSLNPNNVINYSETINWLDPADTDKQCGVIISFQYPYLMTVPFLGSGLGTINIGTSVQMRREDQPAPGSTACP